MVPDAPIWEWKFFDVSIVVSALFFAAARPLWFFGKFLIYAAFPAYLLGRGWFAFASAYGGRPIGI